MYDTYVYVRLPLLVISRVFNRNKNYQKQRMHAATEIDDGSKAIIKLGTI